MTGMTVNVKVLYEVLDLERRQEGLTWRQLAKATQTSPSTFTRIAQGHRPDVDTFMRLCSWLGVSAEEFKRDSELGETREDNLAVISAHLRASKDLSPKSAEAIDEIVRAAYERFREE